MYPFFFLGKEFDGEDSAPTEHKLRPGTFLGFGSLLLVAIKRDSAKRVGFLALFLRWRHEPKKGDLLNEASPAIWLEKGQDPLDVWNLNIIADQIAFTLAATARLKSSPPFVRVWGSNERAILLCVLRRSRSSYAWRLCRVSEGLFLDYG